MIDLNWVGRGRNQIRVSPRIVICRLGNWESRWDFCFTSLEDIFFLVSMQNKVEYVLKKYG